MNIFFKSLIFFFIFLNCGILNSNDSNLSQNCTYLYNQVDLIDEEKKFEKYGLEIYRDLPLAVEYYMLLEKKAYFLTLLQQDCVGVEINVEINTVESTLTITSYDLIQKISFHNYQVNQLEGAWIIPCIDDPQFNSSDDCYFSKEGYASVIIMDYR